MKLRMIAAAALLAPAFLLPIVAQAQDDAAKGAPKGAAKAPAKAAAKPQGKPIAR